MTDFETDCGFVEKKPRKTATASGADVDEPSTVEITHLKYKKKKREQIIILLMRLHSRSELQDI